MSCLVKTTQLDCPPAGPGLRKGCVCWTWLGAEEPGRKPIHSLWTEFSTDAGLAPLGPCAQPLCVIESTPLLRAHTHPAASNQTPIPSCLLCLTHSISTLLTPSIWPPDGSLGLFLTEPWPVGTEPQTIPPLSQAGPWAAEEADAGWAPTMCQTRSQTPALCSVFP